MTKDGNLAVNQPLSSPSSSAGLATPLDVNLAKEWSLIVEKDKKRFDLEAVVGADANESSARGTSMVLSGSFRFQAASAFHLLTNSMNRRTFVRLPPAMQKAAATSSGTGGPMSLSMRPSMSA